MMKRLFTVFLLGLIGGQSHAQFGPEDHIVRNGDTLSQLLYEEGVAPIYGPQGYLQKTLELNQSLKKTGGNSLRPGDQLLIFKKVREPSSEEIIEPKMEAPQEIKKAHPIGDLELQALESFVSIEGKDNFSDSTGKLNSASSHGLGGIWRTNWGERQVFGLGLRSQWINFAKAGGMTLQNRGQRTTDIFGLYQYRFIPSGLLQLTFGQRDEVFYRGLNSTTLTVDKVAVPYLSLGGTYYVLETQSVKLGLRGQYNVHSSFKTSNYKGSTGKGYQVALRMEIKFKAVSLGGELFYSEDRFPVRSVDYTRKDAGLVLGIRYEFEGLKK